MRSTGLLVATFVLASLLGCGGDDPPPPGPPPPPPPPTVVSMTLRATPEVNPDEAGIAKPIRVRVLKLATGSTIAEPDFFALDSDPQKALGDDLKGSETLVLPPGSTQVWQARLEDDVKVVAVIAAYQAIGTAQWRAWKEVPRNATTLLAAELGAKGVALREVAP
jgi:type VI secretion system protein VasD